MKIRFTLLLTLITVGFSFAQTKAPEPDKKHKKCKKCTCATVQSPTTPVAGSGAESKAPKKYSDFITKDAVTSKGFFTIHTVKGKLYFEIPKKQLNKELLVVSRIAETPGIGYGGENTNNSVVRWEMRYDKILLRSVEYINVANDTLPIYKAVKNSNFEPIIRSFDILAYNSDSSNVLIEATPLYTEDVAPFNIQEPKRKELQIKAADKTRSFLDYAKSYPMNVEIKSVITYNAVKPAQQEETQSVSLKFHHSMVLLPEKPMKPRLKDDRVGFFSYSQSEFGETQKVEKNTFIARWRLEPKPEDIENFKKGELVEPIKPIVYYIDPATPVKWRTYLKKGVEDWNTAFEAAGFKNAIQAKDAPTKEEDPDWNAEDARYSVIRYFASPIENAYGPHISDPRTGEILESDIGWYHNVMNLLSNWYFVQVAPLDVRAQQIPLPDTLMGELIRFVSSHEVGHTLGLPHNMKSSHFYPTDSLRSRSFTEKYGTAPSIMDYARFNYVAQPGDNAYLFPKIGEYDKFAISWGYRPILEAKTAEEERSTLNNWAKVQETNPRLRFGRQQGKILDPYAQTEDLGDDAVKSTGYGIKNIERVMGILQKVTEKPGYDFSLLKEYYEETLMQWAREMGHVANLVAGVDRTEKIGGQKGVVFVPISIEKQKEAIKFIADNAFKLPAYMLKEDIVRKFEPTGSSDRLMKIQSRLLNTMLDDDKLNRMIEYYTIRNNGYKAGDAINDISKTVFNTITPDAYQRSLQREFVANMGLKLSGTSDLRSLALLNLINLKAMAGNNATLSTSFELKAHYIDLKQKIDGLIDPKK